MRVDTLSQIIWNYFEDVRFYSDKLEDIEEF